MIINILKMSWRNIWRNKRRTLLTAIAVAVGVISLIFVYSFAGGIQKAVTEDIIAMDCGHIRLAHKEFIRLERILPREYLVQDVSNLEREILEIPGVTYSSARIKFNVLLSHNDVNEPATAIGTEPGALHRRTEMKDRIVQGRYFGENPRKELIMGRKLAEKLELKVGDELLIVTSDINYSTYALPFEVVGLLETGYVALDKHMLFMPLPMAQEMLDCGDAAHEVLFYMDDPQGAPSIAAKIETELNKKDPAHGIQVIPWKENSMIRDMLPMMEQVWGKIAWIIMIIAALVILNTMLMAVMERYHEMGVLKAMGFKNHETFFMILAESFYIGILGAAIGGLLGGGLAAWTEKVGIDMYSMGGQNMADKMDVPFPVFGQVLHPDFTISILIGSVLFGLTCAMLAALYPSYKASRMLPVEAFHSQLKI